jgi:hypothetical protein
MCLSNFRFVVFAFILLGDSLSAAPRQLSESYVELRNMALAPSGSPEPQSDGPVLSLLMDMAGRESIATLVAAADGSASLYLSDSAAIIEAGEYRQVRAQSLSLLRNAAAFTGELVPTKVYPLPRPEYIRFYFVTPSAVLTSEILEDDLRGGNHRLSSLYKEALRLAAYIRGAEQYRRARRNATSGQRR